ncbi:MAG TPA: transferrin receptor-like dimerization domain-containing protein [Verrucomicrobiae bacterium]|jgi:N-acetylated-alpha-linked acidic dipeptidase
MERPKSLNVTIMGLVLIALGFPGRILAGEAAPIYGFSAATSPAELKLEESFRAMPETNNLRQYMQRLSAHPHHLGSPYDKQNAEWILSQMKSWGWDASIETFDVLFPTPKTRVVEMTEPVHYMAALQEPALPADPTSAQADEQLPTYNAYSIDGDVTGPLVFVNYGLPEDYAELKRRGISVEGAIVIAKYGRSWRGIKPKVAAENKAIGCILFSDPRDDGYSAGDVFPEGPMRNTNGVQRGSVMDFATAGPGDPLTPGYGAVAGAPRIPRAQAKALTTIPVLPISSGDALPLLAQLGGPVAPEGWAGSLPITYHLGPGPAKVHLKLEFNWNEVTAYDVISRMAGASASNEWVIRGNHHDAWVNGASDPTSGQVCLLEEARALGLLAQQGWKPRRTIIYCSWDGEEPCLLGSTEWVETHAEELRAHAAAYVNSDDNGRGFLSVGGTPCLENFINGVARGIDDPEVKMSIWQRSLDARIAGAGNAAERRELRARADLPLSPLGSGSDYSSFLDFAGIPCLNVEFHGESSDEGVYHSIYDDFYWYTHFGDTDFVYGRALAQTIGTAVLRLADADVIPYEFNGLASTVEKYTGELQTLLKHKQEDIEERKKEIEEGVFIGASDPRHPAGPPKDEAVPPELNFAPLLNADKALSASAQRYQKAFAAARPKFGDADRAADVDAVNHILLQAEHQLTGAGGLPGRSWYKHLLYAPGVYAGYGAKTMPGPREGIELGHYEEAEREIARVAKALESEAALLDSASGLLARF